MRVRRKALLVLAVALMGSGCEEKPAPAAAATAARAPARAIVDVPTIVPRATVPATLGVVVLRDRASEAWYDGAPALDSVVRAWTGAVESLGATVTVVQSARAVRDADVVLIPAQPCISDETRRLLQSRDGNRPGIILTGLTATRDGGCRYAGHALSIALTGAMRADTLGTRREAYVTVPGDMGPLTADISPGSRLSLRPAPQVAWRHPGRPAYWSDWSLNPTPANDTPLVDAAIVHSGPASPRAVAIGFDITHVDTRERDRALFALLLRNAILWAANRPLAMIAAWPNGSRAAAIITQDVEQDFGLAQHALDSLRSAGVPGTYFLVTDLASEHAKLVRNLAAQGELGSHGDVHDSLGGLSLERQLERLRQSRDVIVDVADTAPRGLRPPREIMDEATLVAWARVGGSYIFGTNDARSASPELVAVGGDTLVLFGRVTQDDFVALRRAGASPDPKALAESFLRDFDKVRALGGVYSFSYHSHLLARPALVPALAAVARGVRGTEGTWVARASDVAHWWRTRARVRVTPAANDGDIVIEVHNDAPDALRGAELTVWLGAGFGEPGVEGGRLRRWSDDRVTVALPPVAAGATHTVRVAGGRS